MTTSRRHGEHQTPFGKWLQENDRVHSVRDSISVTDIDMFIHRYNAGYDKVNHPNRIINHLMLLEIKTHSAEPPFAQHDTLKIVNQVMMGVKYKTGRCNVLNIGNSKGQKVVCKVWGYHLLQLSITSPDNSEFMIWDATEKTDGTRINKHTLERLLRFELNPFTLEKISDRRHHKKKNGVWVS